MARDTIRDIEFPASDRPSGDGERYSGHLHLLRPATDDVLSAGAAAWRARTESSIVARNVAGRFSSEVDPAERFAELCGGQAEFAGQRWGYRASKRALDIAVSALALVLLSPILMVIALLVRIDSPGPCIFVQNRIGYRGRVFGMLKFRTMVESESTHLDGALHKHLNDPRLTRIGRFLRATSLDEIPQLINVLRGEMSLVGPRPEIVEIALTHYEPWQYRRLLVPQGMTGWWQVTGRGAKLLHQHTEDDLYYIEHASFWFDIRIIVMTARAVLRREGAF